jgi:hypothetical protein
MDLTGSGMGPVAGLGENANEPTGIKQGGGKLNQVSEY